MGWALGPHLRVDNRSSMVSSRVSFKSASSEGGLSFGVGRSLVIVPMSGYYTRLGIGKHALCVP